MVIKLLTHIKDDPKGLNALIRKFQVCSLEMPKGFADMFALYFVMVCIIISKMNHMDDSVSNQSKTFDTRLLIFAGANANANYFEVKK